MELTTRLPNAFFLFNVGCFFDEGSGGAGRGEKGRAGGKG